MNAPPRPLSVQQRELTLEIAAVLDRFMEGAQMPAGEALAVLCSISGNILSLDPSPARQADAMTAFDVGLRGEVERLREIRKSQNAHYREAAG